MIVLVLSGMVETYAVFTDTERGILVKNKMMEIAKSGAADAQDDFRLSKYDLSEGHVKEHIKKELYGTKEDLSETERQIVLSEYLDSSEKDILSLLPKRGNYSKYTRDVYRVRANNTERIYFYEADNVYHSSYLCSHLPSDKSGISIYSSMEECALKGAYPCKACVLGLYE